MGEKRKKGKKIFFINNKLLFYIIQAFSYIMLFGSLIISGLVLLFTFFDIFIFSFSFLRIIKILISLIVLSVDIGIINWLDSD